LDKKKKKFDHKERDHMMSRRKARRFALQVLFSNEFLGENIENIIEKVGCIVGCNGDPFGENLIKTTYKKRTDLDQLILKSLKDGDINRVPILDKVIIRLAVSEMLYFPDIPVEVTINEAVDISKEFINKGSSRFINGILDTILKNLQKNNMLIKSVTKKTHP
jgi:N utilization substance protein B